MYHIDTEFWNCHFAYGIVFYRCSGLDISCCIVVIVQCQWSGATSWVKPLYQMLPQVVVWHGDALSLYVSLMEGPLTDERGGDFLEKNSHP